MNEDTLNMEIRKFLKKVGISTQREIEHAILKAIADGQLKGVEDIKVKMTLQVTDLGINQEIEGTISLE